MKSLLVIVSLLAVPALSGCGADADEGDAGTSVVASIYPLAYVAERVAGRHADVETLTSPGTEPHDLELTVQQTAVVSDADLMLYLSGFQPAVDDAVEQVAGGEVVDAADVADLVTASEEHHDHEGATDPHFWLDPNRLSSVAVAVKRELAELDPDHSGDYARNLADLQRDLDRLDADIESGLADCARDTVVVSHNAFGYFAERYGLHFEAINGLSPAAEPSPAHLGKLSRLIENHGITTVFSERLASPELADTLARDLGLQTGVLDPVEGLTDETADEDYLSLMRANLAAIRKANDCS